MNLVDYLCPFTIRSHLRANHITSTKQQDHHTL